MASHPNEIYKNAALQKYLQKNHTRDFNAQEASLYSSMSPPEMSLTQRRAGTHRSLSHAKMRRHCWECGGVTYPKRITPDTWCTRNVWLFEIYVLPRDVSHIPLLRLLCRQISRRMKPNTWITKSVYLFIYVPRPKCRSFRLDMGWAGYD